ncbi:DUF924 family protein [Curvivirga sp.]|uniref:DUF924 family protein n=1 Tax=Curvivirga sp. TaxID=2856848 RepID=UPI003B5CF523
MSQAKIDAVITFWFEESTPQDWFTKSDIFDQKIRDNFSNLHTALMNEEHQDWRQTAKGCLAEIIVLDQFSRNMFRNHPKAFASDEKARECLNHMLERGFDKELSVNERKFTYLPLEHSEDVKDQEKAIACYTELGDELALDYAQQHKVIIDRFGRFPHRNKILGRTSTEEEIEFLEQPGSSF